MHTNDCTSRATVGGIFAKVHIELKRCQAENGIGATARRCMETGCVLFVRQGAWSTFTNNQSSRWLEMLKDEI